MREIIIYCDGASLNNGSPRAIASYGIVMLYKVNDEIVGKKEFSGLCDPVCSTNNYAEIYSAYIALRKIKDKSISVKIYSDSQYLVQTINSKWDIRANKGMWAMLFSELSTFEDVEFIKVKGHSGDAYNERADELAKREAYKGDL